ncbi:MAG: hypothetical protein CMJ83_01720 [Planctomycetes bacterium]|nr:hypothetical protein [Planctomycetota bacterium]
MTRLMTRLLFLIACAGIVCAQDRPNLIVILADDAGAECFGCYGGESYRTPHLDRMAREGLRYDNAFTQPLCTPTRVELLTGRSNARNYVGFSVLKPSERTFAEVLRGAGYRTFVAGKWQLLAAEHYPPHIRGTGSTPEQAGFEGHVLWQVEALGKRHWTPTMTSNGRTKKMGADDYGPDVALDGAIKWIDDGGDKPFLLFWPMILPHAPFIVPPGRDGDRARRDKKHFGSMVEHLDGQVGRLLDHLRERKLTKNTLVLFIGDNGSPRNVTSVRSGKRIRGMKARPNDAGCRVPFVLWAPGRVEGGRATPDLVSTVDVFPTLLQAANVQVPKDRPLDGRSFLGRATGTGGEARRWVTFHHHPRPQTRPRSKPQRWARDTRWQLFDDGRLFDVAADPLLKNPLPQSPRTGDAGGDEAAAARHCLTAGLATLPKAAAKPAPPTVRPRPKRKNVLFMIADDLTASALSCYGSQCHTPAIDSLAARGTRFTRAYCQYPVCGPSRAALMSGLYPQSIGVMGNGQARAFSSNLGTRPSMSQLFKDSGYYTARVSKIYHMRVPGDITAGVDGPDHTASWTERFNCQAPEWFTEGAGEQLSRGKLRFEKDKHYNLGFGTVFYAVRGKSDGREQADVKAASKAIELLRVKRDRPFFLAVGFVRPHVPLVAPASYYGPYPDAKMKLPAKVNGDRADIPKLGTSKSSDRTGLTDDAKKQRVLSAYYASCAFLDAQVGRVLRALDEAGLRDDTIVVFTSDHGYHLGEHDFWQKMSLHEESARIPLIISRPGRKAAVSGSLAQQIDLYPTLAAACGLQLPGHLQGRSLLPVLNDPDHVVHEAVYCFKRTGGLVRTTRHAYLEWRDGTSELYDMEKDPRQFTNVSGVGSYAVARAELEKRLKSKLAQITGK